MNKIVKIALSTMVLVSMSSVSLNADIAKGQKLYLKKLKSACSASGAVMAGKHTGDEWEEIFNSGKLADELRSACPKAKDSSLKEKYLQHYFDFFKEYSSDSGNVPSC